MDVFDDYQVTRLPKSQKAIPKSKPMEEKSSRRPKFLDSNDDHIDYNALKEYGGGYESNRRNFQSKREENDREMSAYDRILDHMWYDRDDESFMMQNNYDEENSYYLAEREAKRQAQLPGHKVAVNRSDKKKTSLSFQKHIDNSLWELTRLKQGGAGSRLATLEMQELNSSNVHKDEAKKIVLVRNVIPPFIYDVYDKDLNLDDLSSGEDTFNQIYNKFLNQAISVVKDMTSDIAAMAKKGSMVMRRLKEESERNATRVRFWDLEGSKLGSLLKLDQIDAQEPEEEHFSTIENNKYSNLINEDLPEEELKEKIEAQRKKLKNTRESLPVFQCRDELLQYVDQFQVMVIVGETGSGKTTQLAQYLYEHGYAKSGIIGCTQPRRVAAVSVCQRVAEEVGTRVGDLVGYSIRFEDVTSKSTSIKFMTDGILLRETLMDPDLDRYSCIIMDEAHERSLNTDVLFGILKSVLARRRDIRVIVTSATMDADKFSRFFGNCPIYKIQGRTFPVRIEYLRSMGNDYVEAAVEKCISLHISEGPGDVLIFMTGQDDINATCELLDLKLYSIMKVANNIDLEPFCVLPIYSQLPSELQQRVFKKYPYRKVIVSTNIAETSLTFEGIKFVIDSGFCKLKVYNPKVGMDSLQITPVSQAGANQRAGRAGRTAPGICFRLYTERTYINDLFENNVPEIRRTNLCNVVLLLKSLKIKRLTEFDFIDPPNVESILSAMLQLWILGGIDETGELTDVGKRMVQYPLEPPLAKIIIAGESEGCLSEVLTVVSVLSAPNIFVVENESDASRESADNAAREKFLVPESDHLTLLNVYKQWCLNGRSASWCQDNKIQHKSLKRAAEVRQQLVEITTKQKLPETSCGNDWDAVRKAICAGYFHNASKLKGFGEYSNLRSFAPCFLHPSSALYGMGYTPDYVVYHEVVITTKEYMRYVTAVYAEWLYQLGPSFFYLKNIDASGQAQRTRDKLENQRLLQDMYIKRTREDTLKKSQEDDANTNEVIFGSRKIKRRNNVPIIKDTNG
ncbi:Helicase associated domain HA2 containing protein [Theileria equi strain WA]|uniref:RNA helicase n=1 Tax=Theileria equi strain WA TaxID=1537102 RepID=L1LBZ4_THEEQ|nr:Helicase associated domain HA2 containing protein [Theileria equi strain WA]EKX72856.1 Helicase associated domain HA2 containing protein [Theileria equi strain WA]|eukprot:XP_004832308.1 Helicase associated domain HA2 containing protein [Theileria equi strain WA]